MLDHMVTTGFILGPLDASGGVLSLSLVKTQKSLLEDPSRPSEGQEGCV